MTVGNFLLIKPYNYLVFKNGSTNFTVLSGNDGSVVYETTDQTDALGAFTYCRDQLGTSGGSVWVKPALYPLSDEIVIDASTAKMQHYFGLGGIAGNTQLRASTNKPVFKITGGAPSCTIENLYLSHNQSSYTTSLIRILDNVKELTLRGLRFDDFGNYKGNGISFEILTNTTSQYKIIVDTIYSNGLENAFYFNINQITSGANNFASSFIFDKIFAWNAKRVAKAIGVTGGQLLGLNMSNIHYQYNSSNSLPTGDSVYDFSGNLSTWLTRLAFNQTWDIPSDVNMIKMGSAAEVGAILCNLTDKVGGTVSKFKNWDYYTHVKGTTTTASTISARDYTITHNLGKTPNIILCTVMNTDTNVILPAVIPQDQVTSTTFKVRFPRPPPLPNVSGGNNLKFSWMVIV